MSVNRVVKQLANLVQDKLDLTTSLKGIGVLSLVAVVLWVVNALLRARDHSREGSVK